MTKALPRGRTWACPGAAAIFPPCWRARLALQTTKPVRNVPINETPHTLNELGQPVGLPLTDWKPARLPLREPLEGRFCRLEPLDPDRHAEDLYAVNARDEDGSSWTYMSYGPFESLAAYRAWITAYCLRDDPLFFAIFDNAAGKPVGVASYLRIAPEDGSIEVGHIHYSEQLRRTPVATEAMYLMMRNTFDLGYRRYEWKCDALNAASRAAGQRLGFSYEGVFAQATVYKGRSRDTAWYAVLDGDWPALREAFTKWLDPANFDQRGRQRTRLSALTRPILRSIG